MKKFHKNNIHNNSYDINSLIISNPKLKEFVVEKYGKLTIDFSNVFAVRELNYSLLKYHYKIDFWNFPKENLCPPIPGRVDYIHYLADYFNMTDKNISVLDIGTGASLIYPLLGTRSYNWSFVGSDIDLESLKYAQKNIVSNGLENRISLRHQKNKENILEGVLKENDCFTFTMCNPPFYKDIDEAITANRRKNTNLGLQQQRNFGGKFNELCYEGGEKAFLHTYLYESSKYSTKSKWFTSLVSKKDNVKSLEKSAKKLNVKSFEVILMQQGNKITRIVCWSF